MTQCNHAGTEDLNKVRFIFHPYIHICFPSYVENMKFLNTLESVSAPRILTARLVIRDVELRDARLPGVFQGGIFIENLKYRKSFE